MKILLFSILFVAATVLKGQDTDLRKHSLRLGVNLALHASSGSFGIGNYAEYGFWITERIAIVPRIMSANADQRLGNEEFHFSQLGASVAVRITPFPSFYRGLKADLGFLYQRIRTSTIYSSAIGGTNIQIFDRSFAEKKDVAGILGSLSFGILQGERLGAGLRSELMSAFRKTAFTVDLIQFGIYMSVDF